MIKLFEFQSTTPSADMMAEVNAFIADQWEESRDEWEFVGPITVKQSGTMIISLVLRRRRAV